jgi:hypothetical protein
MGMDMKRPSILILAIAVIMGCGDSGKTADVSVEAGTSVTIEMPVLFSDFPLATPTPIQSVIPVVTSTSTVGPIPTVKASPFLLSPDLCDDNDGPNCKTLRLGDDYLTMDTPASGYLYSCNAPNPNAPGANESEITWINFAEKTWDFMQKLWLPSGSFSPSAGVYTENIVGIERQIDINNLPVDGEIGDWPMTQYPQLSKIDGNPGVPAAALASHSYTAEPAAATAPNCVSLGAIGVTKNGVVLYSAVDGRGEDALAREIVDVFGGHPAGSNYHYHYIPLRLDNETQNDGHSGIVGYISDGFPIYGYKGEGGREMSNDDLDACHGHGHGSIGYHYHATIEYPYTVGCYKGISSAIGNQGGLPQGRPPRRP